MEGSHAVYLALAARTDGAKTGAKVVLRLRLENKGSSTLKVKAIRFSFPGSSHPATNMQGVNMDGSLDIAPGGAAVWSNGVVDLDPDPDVSNNVSNAVYLTGAAPSKVKVDVTCKTFTTPASLTLSLAAARSPVDGHAYRFPYACSDLRASEYFETSAQHWANGGSGGTQIFAHDIGVVGWNGKTKSWSSLLPGGSKMKNADYRIWDKPVRAMADGTVEDWLETMDNNTIVADANGSLQFPTPTPSPVTGNFVLIRHGTEVMKYCHLRKGSIPDALKVDGAVVREGQELGRAGNSGNSTNPHTHIECERLSDLALRPIPLRDGSVIDRAKLSPPSAKGPWFRLNRHGISKDAVSIWPSSTSPGFPVPTFGISRGGDWANSFFIRSDRASFEKTAQELFDQHGRRLVRATTFLQNGARWWAGISRAGDWANRFWVSDSLTAFTKTAQDLFDQKGLRLLYASTFVQGGKRSWIGISRGGTWASRLIIKDSLSAFSKEAQRLFDDDGLRLIHVMTWQEGSKRRWLGISRSGDWTNRWWISPDLGSFSTKAQQLFDHEQLRLVHVTSFTEGSQRKWIGISRSGDWANRWYFRGDLDLFSLEAQQLFDHKGLRLVHVEMLE
jgi:hypothetical protein